MQHSILERPVAYGNDAFGRFRDAVKVRMYLATSSKKVPDELAGTSGMHFFSLVAKVYESGKGGELEGSVVHHMMLHLLQQLAGVPHPQVSSKLFALARAMRRIHKPSYEFLSLEHPGWSSRQDHTEVRGQDCLPRLGDHARD